MDSSDTISFRDLRRRLYEVLDSLCIDKSTEVAKDRQQNGAQSEIAQKRAGGYPSVDQSGTDVPVIKAIPVAFPVVEVSFTLRERVPEPIGLIRRAVLHAVFEFGPCNSRDVDELLGLGSDIVERTLVELANSFPYLVQRETEFTAGPMCSQLLKSGSFTRLVTHERRFVVNGLTDKLMPIKFWKTHRGIRLFPNPSDSSGPMCTESGVPTPVAAKIVDRGVSGRDHLQQLVLNGDTTSRQIFGLPAGVCEQVEEPSAIRIAWVLSFILVRADGSVELHSARRNATVLLERSVKSREYLRHVCQGMESRFLKDDASTQLSEKWCDRWPEGTQFEQGAAHGEVLVKLAEPNKLLRNEMDMDVKEKNGRHLLEQGRDWVPHTFKIYQIVPGDVETARATTLLRGIRELRYILRTYDPSAKSRPSINLNEWWLSWQSDFENQGGLRLPKQLITVEDLLKVADQVNDTEFQDKLEWILR
jgi:hypothetical protein